MRFSIADKVEVIGIEDNTMANYHNGATGVVIDYTVIDEELLYAVRFYQGSYCKIGYGSTQEWYVKENNLKGVE